MNTFCKKIWIKVKLLVRKLFSSPKIVFSNKYFCGQIVFCHKSVCAMSFSDENFKFINKKFQKMALPTSKISSIKVTFRNEIIIHP